jgi:lactate dehydrogenase-like 2-hydroxyacid dehydrogenase
MAEAVDVLLVVIPGTPSTKNLVDSTILKALGPNGILINIGRGIVVDNLKSWFSKGTPITPVAETPWPQNP